MNSMEFPCELFCPGEKIRAIKREADIALGNFDDVPFAVQQAIIRRQRCVRLIENGQATPEQAAKLNENVVNLKHTITNMNELDLQAQQEMAETGCATGADVITVDGEDMIECGSTFLEGDRTLPLSR